MPILLALLLPEDALACPVTDYHGLTCNAYYGPLSVLDQYGNEQTSYPTCDAAGKYTGSEDQLEFTPPAGTKVYVEVNGPATGNVNLFVTDTTCDGACAGKSMNPGSLDEWASFVADGGAYIINVDDLTGAKKYDYDVMIGCDTTCSTADVAAPITCSVDLDGDTTGGTLALDFYACGDPSPRVVQDGAEDIYTFVAQRTGDVTLHLDGIDATKDQDLYVLEAACDPEACVASDDATGTKGAVTFHAKAGTTYYVVVEGFGGMGPYRLTADVGAGGCLEDCDDGVDNDGDGVGDCADSDCATDPVCDCASPVSWFADADADGHGAGNAKFDTCGWPAPSGLVSNFDDCKDSDALIHPGATETCNGKDDDCDGKIDEDVQGQFWPDLDHDGHGDAKATPSTACTAPADSVDVADDCDDTDPDVFIGADELCDQKDDDCDGRVDEGAADPSIDEVCNGVDDDCDGTIDEGTDCYDDDGDGVTEQQGDCDDANFDVSPDATEVPNGVDDDCDGIIDNHTSAYDDDGDGYTEDFGDCDDANPNVNVGVPEVADNGIDDDCDGQIDEHASGDDTDAGDDTDSPVPVPIENKCGCSSASSSALWAWFAAGVLLVRRRRRYS